MGDEGKFESPSGSGQEFSCIDFDLTLSDAIEGRLAGADLARFQRHVAGCPTCGPIFTDTQAGLNWLRVLEPAAAPANLVHNILTATSLQDEAVKSIAEQRGWRRRMVRILEAALLPVYNTVRQPRFALNAAMAFFSISLLLNVAGLKFSGVRLSDLTPSAIKSNATLKYYETTSRVVKYYENIRFVYELESTVRELKRATTNAQPEQNSTPKKKNDNTTQQPEKRNENYSRRDEAMVLAAARIDSFHSGRLPLEPKSSQVKEAVFEMMSNQSSIQDPRRLA